MAETYATRAEYAFQQALTDQTNMLQPATLGGGPLLDPAIFDVRLGGDGSVNDANGKLTLPLTKLIVTIGQPYGTEESYTADTDVDCEIWVPFKIWGNTGADISDFDTRMGFARQFRSSVFSLQGLTLLGGVVRRRPIQYNADQGLMCREFVWRFWWGAA